MKRNLIFTTVIAVSLAVSAAAPACADETEAKELTKITFCLDWTPNTNHTGIYTAIEKGYFDEAGLDVTVVQPPDDGAEVLVASGQAQFGVSFQDTMADALSGDTPLPITAVAAVVQHNTSGIVSRKGEGMDRPSGMEGHSYATWEWPVEQATVRQDRLSLRSMRRIPWLRLLISMNLWVLPPSLL